MTDKIRYIKLTNGQELIATQVNNENGKLTVLADAAVVFLAAGKAGQQAPVVNLAPFAPFTTDNELILDDKDVVFNSTANEEISDFYKKATGKSTIITPNKSLII